MTERTQTFGQLMKSMKAMGGSIAPKSAILFNMLDQRLQRLEEEVVHVSDKCELKSESMSLVYDAESRLGAIMNDLRNSNFLRAGDIREIVKAELDESGFALDIGWRERVEIFLTGIIGGVAAFIGMAVIYG